MGEMSKRHLAEEIGINILKTGAVFLNSKVSPNDKLKAGGKIAKLLEFAENNGIDTKKYRDNLDAMDIRTGGAIQYAIFSHVSITSN